MKRLFSNMLLVAASCCLASTLAHAEYPERPLRIFVGSAAGAAADIAIRVIAEKAQQYFGQPIVIDNKSGGLAGGIATQALLLAPADGYSAVYQTTAMTILPWMTKLAYDPNDLVPVIRTGNSPYAIVVSSSFPAKTLDEFVAYAKSRPGQLNCSTIGVGSAPHLAMELLMKEANINIMHVPYRGFGLAYPDLQAGRIDCSIEAPITVVQYVKAGSLSALGLTQKQPSPELPTWEPIAAKYPTVDVSGWGGLFVSKNTPKSVIERLHSDFAKAIRHPDVAKKLKDFGVQSDAEPTEAFAAMIGENRVRYGQVVKDRNIKLAP